MQAIRLNRGYRLRRQSLTKLLTVTSIGNTRLSMEEQDWPERSRLFAAGRGGLALDSATGRTIGLRAAWLAGDVHTREEILCARRLTGLLAGIGIDACLRHVGVRAGTDDLLGRMGSGQLSAGTGQRVRGGNRRQGHGRDHPWSDFQTKAFTEFNAKGDAYDMVVGDSPVARRRRPRAATMST